MPTRDSRRRLRTADVQDVVAAHDFPEHAPDSDAVGLEVEWFPIVTHGRRTSRLALGGDDGLEARMSAVATLPDGARLQAEPGAQLEVATAPMRSVEEVLRSVDRARIPIDDDEDSLVLAAAGIDLWHHRLPSQQLATPRYPAMAAYFRARGSHEGALMMRHTCSLQLNVDLGRGDVARQRWEVSLLASPVSSATFAASPSMDGAVVSRRALAWQQLDPTRTGIPDAFLAHPEWEPARQVADAALAADIMLVNIDDHMAVPGTPGWTFGDWLHHGHPEHGWPTAADLRYHLTTLFHEVRPRGWLELRSLDAVPAPWREAAVVLHVGMLFDAAARSRVLEVLEPSRQHLPDMLRRAARQGVSDPAMCALAVEIWSFALDGARRRPDLVDPAAIRRTEHFLDRFTMRGRCPADAMREAHQHSPMESLALAAEPLSTVRSSSQ